MQPLSPIHNLKWIFFDLDDTLWDFSANSDLALKTLYDESSRLNSIFKSFELFSYIYHKHNDRLWKDYAAGLIDAETLKRLRFRLTMEEANAKAADDEILAMNSHYLDLLVDGRAVIDGAEDTLKTLYRHYLIGIISNGFSETQYRKIYTTSLNKYITRLITSAEAGFTKPNPEIFNYALMATGATTDNSVMVGDNADTDIRGAISAGMPAIYYHRHPQAAIPDFIYEIVEDPLFWGTIYDLSELPELLG